MDPKESANIDCLKSNKELIRLVGLYISYQERLNGWNDASIGRAVGCTKQGIYSVRHGITQTCSISFISHIARVFGFTLVELIDEARRVEAEGL